jgi:acetolactate synthase-1/2/3 large subunit
VRRDARLILEELVKHVARLDTAEWIKHLDGYKKKYPLKYKKQVASRCNIFWMS